MSEVRIVPRFKLLVSYNIDPHHMETYHQFVLGEFVPAVQAMGLYMLEAWHTAYGPYPVRLLGFVAEDMETIRDVLDSGTFHGLEEKLLKFVSDYTRRIVRFREGFQFTESEVANGGR